MIMQITYVKYFTLVSIVFAILYLYLKYNTKYCISFIDPIIFILNMQMFYLNWEKNSSFILTLWLYNESKPPQMYLYWVKCMHHNEREEMNGFERCEKLWELRGWTEWHSGIWVIISSYGTSLPVLGYQDL